MQLERYSEYKSKNLIQLIDVFGPNKAIAKRKFDAETGEEIAPEIQSFSVAQIDEQIARFQDIISNLEEMKADLQAGQILKEI
jgi:uncharacterized small protein (DUF1192 family)